MKIVFLHGLESSPNSTKATYLRSMGHDVVAPHLPKDLWEQSVMEARRAIEQHLAVHRPVGVQLAPAR